MRRDCLASRVNKHFLELVARGGDPAASGGEYAAFVIAATLSDLVVRLDSEAVRGVHQWIDACLLACEDCRDYVEGVSCGR